MLTADLVDARKKDGELILRPLDQDGRAEALAIASALVDAARGLVGRRREELEEAWDAATNDVSSKRIKVAAGLRKLAADACTFEAETDVEPSEIRRVLFTHASEVRRTHAESERFDRTAVVAGAAKMLGVAPEVVERSMFADLRSEHVLRTAPALDAASLVEAWELGQTQAVLLTAVRLTCEVRSASPGLVRAFFAKLKFHKLLFSAERIDDREDPGWKIVIDGPFSMFDAVTKYVATHRPESLTWKNSRALGADVPGALRELKKQDGPTLLTQGSSELIHILLAHDLVDELRLLVFPLVLGKGKRLFSSDALSRAYDLKKSVASPKGVIAATYERAGDVKTGSFAFE